VLDRVDGKRVGTGKWIRPDFPSDKWHRFQSATY
jgi:hypothetical protein